LHYRYWWNCSSNGASVQRGAATPTITLTSVKRLEIDAPCPVINTLRLYREVMDGVWQDCTNSVLWHHSFDPSRKVVMVSEVPITGKIEIS
ncbi:MAG: hypothetical protein ACRC8W_09245, partial [Plesiomonas shigelloides]